MQYSRCRGRGLNLHHRCRLVIDVELPWNPLRLEQRIGGSIVGQRAPCTGFGSSRHDRSKVLEHLRGRHQRADRDIAAAVFDGTPIHQGTDIRSAVVGTAKEGLPAHNCTAFQGKRNHAVAHGPRAGASALTVVALHRVNVVNEAGYLVGEELQASRVQFARSGDRRRWRLGHRRPRRVKRQRLSTHQAVRRPRAPNRNPRASERSRMRYQRSLFDGRAASTPPHGAVPIASTRRSIARVAASHRRSRSRRRRADRGVAERRRCEFGGG